jgi:hypothetical protein
MLESVSGRGARQRARDHVIKVDASRMSSTSSNCIADHEKPIVDDDRLHTIHDDAVPIIQRPQSPHKPEIEEEQSQWCTKSCSGAASVRLAHHPLHAHVPHSSKANRNLSQASQSVYGNSVSKCDLSSTRNLYGPTPCSEAWEQASGIGYKAWTRDSRRFWGHGDRVCWRREREGQKGRRRKRKSRGLLNGDNCTKPQRVDHINHGREDWFR